MTPGDGQLAVGYRVRFPRRGIATLGPFEIVALDPFGLARRTFSLGPVTEVTVAPEIVALGASPRRAGLPGGGTHRTTAYGQGADNLTARPYLPGDSMRRVHWRATARHGELMVREEEQETRPDALVVLDRSVERFPGHRDDASRGDGSFEAAVRAAASVAARLVDDGYAVSVIDARGASLAPALVSTADVVVLAAALATATVHAGDALPGIAERIRPRAPGVVVLVTGRLHTTDVLGAVEGIAVVLAADPEADAEAAATSRGGARPASVPARISRRHGGAHWGGEQTMSRADRPRSSWRTTVAVAFALVAAALPLFGVITVGAWCAGAIALAAVVLAAGGVTRVLGRGGLVTALVQVAAWYLFTMVVFLRDTAIGGVVATGATVEAVTDDLRQAASDIALGSAPLAPTPALSFCLVAAIGLLAILIDQTVTSLRLPLVAIVVVVAVWVTPSVAVPGRFAWTPFLALAVAVLLLLRSDRRGGGVLALGLGAVAVVVALVLTPVLPTPPPLIGPGEAPRAASTPTSTSDETCDSHAVRRC